MIIFLPIRWKAYNVFYAISDPVMTEKLVYSWKKCIAYLRNKSNHSSWDFAESYVNLFVFVEHLNVQLFFLMQNEWANTTKENEFKWSKVGASLFPPLEYCRLYCNFYRYNEKDCNWFLRTNLQIWCMTLNPVKNLKIVSLFFPILLFVDQQGTRDEQLSLFLNLSY